MIEEYQIQLHTREQIERLIRYINTKSLLPEYCAEVLNQTLIDARHKINGMKDGDTFTLYFAKNPDTERFVNWLILTELSKT